MFKQTYYVLGIFFKKSEIIARNLIWKNAFSKF